MPRIFRHLKYSLDAVFKPEIEQVDTVTQAEQQLETLQRILAHWRGALQEFSQATLQLHQGLQEVYPTTAKLGQALQELNTLNDTTQACVERNSPSMLEFIQRWSSALSVEVQSELHKLSANVKERSILGREADHYAKKVEKLRLGNDLERLHVNTMKLDAVRQSHARMSDDVAKQVAALPGLLDDRLTPLVLSLLRAEAGFYSDGAHAMQTIVGRSQVPNEAMNTSPMAAGHTRRGSLAREITEFDRIVPFISTGPPLVGERNHNQTLSADTAPQTSIVHQGALTGQSPPLSSFYGNMESFTNGQPQEPIGNTGNTMIPAPTPAQAKPEILVGGSDFMPPSTFSAPTTTSAAIAPAAMTNTAPLPAETVPVQVIPAPVIMAESTSNIYTAPPLPSHLHTSHASETGPLLQLPQGYELATLTTELSAPPSEDYPRGMSLGPGDWLIVAPVTSSSPLEAGDVQIFSKDGTANCPSSSLLLVNAMNVGALKETGASVVPMIVQKPFFPTDAHSAFQLPVLRGEIVQIIANSRIHSDALAGSDWVLAVKESMTAGSVSTGFIPSDCVSALPQPTSVA